jgi:2-octaprenylphenol hydroxylase
MIGRKTMQDYDIVIIGSGIVGLTCASALATTGLRIAILEAKSTSTTWQADKYDIRVSAINAASQAIFQALGAWSIISNLRKSAFRDMHVWDEKGEIHFSCTQIARPYLGHIIENSVMQQALLDVIKNHPNITLCYESQPVAITGSAERQIITLKDGTTLQANLLIGADGAHSWLREYLQIPLRTWSYQQNALITTVHTEMAHQATAWQRFLPTGTLAFLPLVDEHMCSIVWSINDNYAHHYATLTEQEFNHSLSSAFNYQLGKTQVIDKRVSIPLYMRHAQQYVQPHIALIGDAVHTLHPLAGQGVNLGILDAVCLAEVVAQALAKKQNIGDYNVLRRYERWRKGENSIMIAAMEGFKRLFTHDANSIIKARGLGLTITNKLTNVKSLFIKRAMGLTGDLPHLARSSLLD